jgi:hypothetical protein
VAAVPGNRCGRGPPPARALTGPAGGVRHAGRPRRGAVGGPPHHGWPACGYVSGGPTGDAATGRAHRRHPPAGPSAARAALARTCSPGALPGMECASTVLSRRPSAGGASVVRPGD